LAQTRGRVALFVTCLVDLFRPTVGFAAVRLIERAGYTVEVPEGQTCCGQPGFNSGDRTSARALAERVVAAFEGYDHVVVPSGSCGGMIKTHYPEVFAGDPVWEPRARRLAACTHELVAFLADVAGVEATGAAYPGTVTYHDSCSGLRELGVRDQARRLLGRIDGLTLKEMRHPEVCCGFGGTFCVKYPAISVKMASEKTADVKATGAGTLLAGDMGCLLNMAGRLSREGSDIQVRHVAEVLAGLADRPAIGRPATDRTPS
jgi:L-lactate dehydrogenase complex protein LldE